LANSIKYNSGSTESFSLRKGDFYLGVGDVTKGPTNITGFWNGSDLAGVKYVIYLNKAEGGPSIYGPADDSNLIFLTNKISGSSYTTIAECLSWFATQNDKMVVNKTYPPLLTENLLYLVDGGFIPSYSTQGTTALDVSTNANTLNLINGTSYNTNGYFVTDGVNDYLSSTNPASINTIGNSDPFTFSVLFKLTQYANQNLSDAENYSSLLMKSSYTPSFGISMRYDLPSGGVFTRARTYSGVRNTTLSSTSPGYGQPNLTSSSSFSLNRWYQVDFTSEFSDTSYFFKTYINGVLDSTATRTSSLYPVAFQNTGNLTSGVSPLAGNGIYSPLNISRTMVYKKTLSLSEVQQNYYQAPIVTDGLVFTIDAGNLVSFESGTSTAYSLIGTNESNLLNGVGFNNINNGTWTFDGSDDWLRNTTFTALGFDVSWSIGCWFRTSTTQISNVGLITLSFFPNLMMNSAGMVYAWNSVGSAPGTGFSYPTLESNTFCKDGKWHYAITSYSTGGLAKIYIDGVLKNSASYAPNGVRAIYSGVDIGVEKNNGPKVFNGDIALGHVYNRQITDQEVFQNFNAQRSRFGV
jgi:hypothetical protein